jgi:hypothetical protein
MATTLEELEARRAQARLGGGKARIDAQHAKGRLTARERTFELEEAPGGISLTITESGFDQIPLERRTEAFTSNEQGWTEQTKLIQKYLEQFSGEKR